MGCFFCQHKKSEDKKFMKDFVKIVEHFEKERENKK